MLWHVRASLEDRPGSLAALAASCGDRGVNVLGLEIFPTADARVLDAIVLHTPGGWAAHDVEELCLLAGATSALVLECSSRALQDQPVRWVRAAAAVVEDPGLLEDQLARLLEASPQDRAAGPETLVLEEGPGPVVRLTRQAPFTDAEVARASELRGLAARVASATGTAVPTSSPVAPVLASPAGGTISRTVVVRRAGPDDVAALVAMHGRCSADTLRRRYHAPRPRLTDREARAMLEPPGGTSLVLDADGDVVGIGMLAEGPDGPELGIVVEDHWQRQGHGTRLLRALAVEAASRGAHEVTCTVLPDSDAVLRTIRRSGLRALATYVDGVTQYKLLVAKLAGHSLESRRSSRPSMGVITAPLLSLLHTRSELREVYRPPAAIDQAVRGGA